MRFLIYAVILVVGMLIFSQVIALMELEPVPYDIAYDQGNWHIHIPVLYSLGATAALALLIWFFRR